MSVVVRKDVAPPGNASLGWHRMTQLDADATVLLLLLLLKSSTTHHVVKVRDAAFLLSLVIFSEIASDRKQVGRQASYRCMKM